LASVQDRFATVHLNIERTETLPNPRGMTHLFREWKLGTATQESFWVLAYDAAMNVRTLVEICRGTYATVGVHLPSLFSAVLLSGSDRFVVVHNHPTNDTTPTKADIDTTKAVMAGANPLGLYFEDHFIIGPTAKAFSFAASKLLVPAPYTGRLNA
jgi:DNA repair protein RadC